MVVFTCNHCGESLQKPRVEKHYSFNCRREKFLTCVDCFTDFRGDEYNVHIKCVTEEQRYSGKDYVEKTKKGEVKQESWMEMIKLILMHEPNLKPQYRNLLNTISNYNNVPRKRVKFINFIKSSTGGRINIQDIEAVWDVIEKHKSQNIEENIKENNSNEKSEPDLNETSPKNKKKKSKDTSNNITENNDNRKSEQNITLAEENGIENVKNKKKHKMNEGELTNSANSLNEDVPKKKTKKAVSRNESDEITNNTLNETESSITEVPQFSFNEQIMEILTKKEIIRKKKLCKKILNRYLKHTGIPITEEKIQKKINKKLKKCDNVCIENDFVKIISK